MKKAISVATKKRGRPKTTGKGTRVGLRLHPPMLTALDDWAAENDCTRADAIREAVRQLVGLDPEAKRKR
jgi:hypothetical protein